VPTPDLNLLITLDVLLEEGNVERAARRLRLSSSAMSRALARLRTTTGDPLLVRAGRRLVPTPRAEALRAHVHQLVTDAQGMLRPEKRPDLSTLRRTFTLRTSDGFVESYGQRLIERVTTEAPHVRLSFLQKPEKNSVPLREGRVDLETGIVEESLGPEVRTQALFRDRLVGVVRTGHALCEGKVTAERYSTAAHVIVSRTGAEQDAVDLPFLPANLARRVVASVSGFAPALALARSMELVATVPERHTSALRGGMFTFALPVTTKPFTVSMMWHPRLSADPVHQWLRTCCREACSGAA
jgi:DNA-binding transcriptional LysR family regulator